MNDKITQDEQTLAGLAHASILLGVLTGGIGGIVVALIIWLTQKEKSAFVAAQSLQALVYQVVTTAFTWVIWACWGLLWLLLLLPPLFANPDAYQDAPPPGLWVGLCLMIVPFGLWGLTILYGLWGALRSFSGMDFRYAVIGRWLERR
jgi:uncharacterized Tic20 family protein